MTIAEYRNELKKKLGEMFPDEGDVLADLLLCEAFEIPRYRLYTQLLADMTRVAAEKINGFVYSLSLGIPVQYVLGKCHFYGCEIKVGNGVFIPRSDTEVIVKTALGCLKPGDRFADLCSGSGCIPRAIVHEMPSVTGVALELSLKALPYTEYNLKGTNVSVRRFDVLDDDDYRALEKDEGSFDLITCNPPYIPTDDIELLSTQVHYEPESALDGGDDGLRYYRAVISYLPIILKPTGTVVFEIGYDQAKQVSEIMKNAGFTTAVVKDFGGNDRCVFGKRY